jgi:hypothetical protein
VENSLQREKYMEIQIKYFEVTAKCGHVGKTYFYKGIFFVKAQDGKIAARLIRKAPRVKHNHKNAILNVCEINYTEYREGCKRMSENPYFNCHNSIEQRCINELIENDIYIDECNVKSLKNDNSGHMSKIKATIKAERKYKKFRLFEQWELLGA